MRKLILMLALTGFLQPCFAYKGDELKKFALEDKKLAASAPAADSYYAGVYGGYVNGVSNLLQALKITCAPDDVTIGQVKDVVFNYMNAHPELLHLEGISIVTRAINEVWPCRIK